MKIDKTRIVSRGDIAKFKIEITHADFDQQTDNFYVVLTWGMTNQSMTIPHEDIKHDEDGNFFMLVPTARLVGPLKAYCHYYVTDSDMGSGQREEIDIQMLAFVTDTPCVHLMCCGCDAREHRVEYKPVYGSDFSTAYLVLRTSEQEVLRDSEGNAFRIRKEQN